MSTDLARMNQMRELTIAAISEQAAYRRYALKCFEESLQRGEQRRRAAGRLSLEAQAALDGLTEEYKQALLQIVRLGDRDIARILDRRYTPSGVRRLR